MTLTKQWYQILSQYENECSFILFPRVAPHRLECILNHYIAQRTNCDAVDRNVVPQKSVNSQTNYTYIPLLLSSSCLVVSPNTQFHWRFPLHRHWLLTTTLFSLLINLPNYSLHDGVICRKTQDCCTENRQRCHEQGCGALQRERGKRVIRANEEKLSESALNSHAHHFALNKRDLSFGLEKIFLPLWIFS